MTDIKQKVEKRWANKLDKDVIDQIIDLASDIKQEIIPADIKVIRFKKDEKGFLIGDAVFYTKDDRVFKLLISKTETQHIPGQFGQYLDVYFN